MSVAIKDIFHANRPPGKLGRADRYLPAIAQDMRRLLSKIQRDFHDPSVVWPGDFLSEAAVILVELGEDLHANAGLWRSLENTNRELFGTPLPLVADPAVPLNGFDPRRVQHLLWTLWLQMNPENCPSPAHPILLLLADAASGLLEERFRRMPPDSGVKTFLAGSSRFGWEIKRKLVWLGTHSYLFRQVFDKYVRKQKQGASIGIIDDFICQEDTTWSGMAAIHVLGGALPDVSEEDRASLLSWDERHAAFYRVVSRQTSGEKMHTLVVRNFVNGECYTVSTDMAGCPFEPGLVVFGSLTPWRNEWYWSGEQRIFRDLPEAEDAMLRKRMLEMSPAIAYRYCPAEAAQARASILRLHAEFVAYHGDDLAVFPDGLALASAEQKRLEARWQAADQEDVRRIRNERGLTQSRPQMQFPRSILDHDQGIGMFFNPDEGQDHMLGFKHVMSGMRKQGDGLSGTERLVLRNLVTSQNISLAFVERLIREYGAESLLETFHLRSLPPERTLAFLLRCHKGRFFRNRYPLLALV